MRLNFLTNPSPLLQEKMRFFADTFNFYNEFLGTLPGVPFDNPISLLDKIVFQITTNVEYCPMYIDRYLLELDQFDDNLIKECAPTYEQVQLDFISTWNSLQTQSEKKNWIKSAHQIIPMLHQTISELNEKLFDRVMSLMYSYIICEHSLLDHKAEIECSASILVSIFRLNNISKETTARFINRILSRNPSEFPLPIEIANKEEDSDYKQHLDTFLKERSFKAQFYGLKNILDRYKNRKALFFYPIKGMKLSQENQSTFENTFNKVTFYAANNNKLAALKKDVEKKANEKERETGASLFFDENNIIAVIELPYDNAREEAKSGRKMVENELQFFRAYLQNPILSTYSTDWIAKKSMESEKWSGNFHIIGWNPEVTIPNQFELNDLRENPFMRLRKVEHASANEILRNEEVIYNAINQENPSSYWLFLENIDKQLNRDKTRAKELFVNLCLKTVVPFNIGWLNAIVAGWLNDHMFENSEKETGISRQQATEFWEATRNLLNQSIDWNKYTSSLKHEFVKDTIEYSKELSSNVSLEIWKIFFLNLAQDFAAYRNGEFHGGHINQYNHIKLKAILPPIFRRIRGAIINAAEKNPTLTFSQLVQRLMDPNDPMTG